jgi:hypothetical protein
VPVLDKNNASLCIIFLSLLQYDRSPRSTGRRLIYWQRAAQRLLCHSPRLVTLSGLGCVLRFHGPRELRRSSLTACSLDGSRVLPLVHLSVCTVVESSASVESLLFDSHNFRKWNSGISRTFLALISHLITETALPNDCEERISSVFLLNICRHCWSATASKTKTSARYGKECTYSQPHKHK